jgi:hypothetical protein
MRLRCLDEEHEGLTLGLSHIQGVGVFATHMIKANTGILFYEGDELSREDFKEKYGKDMRYVYQRPNYIPMILHAKERRNMITFVNSPEGTDLKSNCYLKRRWLITSRVIEEGEELLLDYPVGYFQSY